MRRSLLALSLLLVACPKGPEDPDETGDDCAGGLTFVDADQDGFGDPDSGACSSDAGRVDNDLDCDDADASIRPEGDEVCDGVDNDCDGSVDTVQGHPLCDDALEDNDEAFDASEGLSAEGLVVLQNDPDFFVVPVCPGRDTLVSVDFDNAAGNLDMRVYDRFGDVFGTLQGDGDSEAALIANPSRTGVYVFVEVFARPGDLNSNTYDLTISQQPGECADAATPAPVEVVFGDDVVLNNALARDPEQDAMDIDGNVLVTQSFIGSSSALPDDGFFPATAAHPAIQLPYNELDDGPNARIIAPGESQRVFLPALSFERLHVLGTSTDGNTTVDMVIEANGIDILTEEVTVRDWFGSVPASGSYALITGIQRWDEDDDFLDTRANFSVWGHALELAQPGVATSVTFTNDGPGNYVLLGASFE